MTAAGIILERQPGLTIWRQISIAIAAEIGRGDFPPGAQLPTEKQLAERFGVNRHTIRQAMIHLAERGSIRVERGRGTFVAAPVLDYAVGSRTRFSENILRTQKQPRRQLLTAEILPADAEVSNNLGLPRKAMVWKLDILNRADNRKIGLSSNYFPADLLPGMAQAFRRAGSVTEALRLQGIENYRRRTTRVRAALFSVADARLLGIQRSRPALISEAVSIDTTGRIVEFCHARFDAAQVNFTILHQEGAGA